VLAYNGRPIHHAPSCCGGRDHGWYAQPPRKTSVDVEGACSGDWTGGQVHTILRDHPSNETLFR
jgi:hypothetical protein